jgi:hypothetical protein
MPRSLIDDANRVEAGLEKFSAGARIFVEPDVCD